MQKRKINIAGIARRAKVIDHLPKKKIFSADNRPRKKVLWIIR